MNPCEWGQPVVPISKNCQSTYLLPGDTRHKVGQDASHMMTCKCCRKPHHFALAFAAYHVTCRLWVTTSFPLTLQLRQLDVCCPLRMLNHAKKQGTVWPCLTPWSPVLKIYPQRHGGCSLATHDGCAGLATSWGPAIVAQLPQRWPWHCCPRCWWHQWPWGKQDTAAIARPSLESTRVWFGNHWKPLECKCSSFWVIAGLPTFREQQADLSNLSIYLKQITSNLGNQPLQSIMEGVYNGAIPKMTIRANSFNSLYAYVTYVTL